MLFFSQPQQPVPTGYHLVWSDEFEKDGPPNPANWTFEYGFVRNKELQWYQPQNAIVRNHRLIIVAKREHLKNDRYDPSNSNWQRNREFSDYSSACLVTKGLHEWLYGRVEVCARIQAKSGLWPAIWTLGESGPWPSCGEVDILEFYQNTILANTCFGTGQWHTVKTPFPQFTAADPNWEKKFHVWRMDWDESSIKLYLDNQLLNETDVTKTINPDGSNAFHKPEYLLLNLAVGSTGGDPSQTKFPAKFEIKSVRVYQRNP